MKELTTDQKYDLLCDFIQSTDRVEMNFWQIPVRGTPVENAEDFHACGNTACIGGHLSLLPEFQATDRASMDSDGRPLYLGFGGALAIQAWFDYELEFGFYELLIYGHSCVGRYRYEISRWKLWTAKEAVQALRITQQCKGDFYQYVKDLNGL